MDASLANDFTITHGSEAERHIGLSPPQPVHAYYPQPAFTTTLTTLRTDNISLPSMSFDERSPKRQRRSYSPPSPPETKPVFVAQHPHTPPPSVHMSPSWNAQTSSLQHGGSVTFPTPPSTAGYHGQMSGKGPTSEGGVESVSSTPVDSGNIGRKDGDGDADIAAVEAKPGHRRTDHERQTKGSRLSEGAAAGGSGKLPGLFKLSTRRKFTSREPCFCLVPS